MQYPLLSLSASAGSGKTYQLTMRYLELLLLGAKPSNILTLTFTRKAAQEMEERIIHKIKELYINKTNRDYIKNLEFISISNEQEWETLQNKIDKVYHTFLREDLKITTIDAFFQKILKSFCWYVGVEYDFNIQEDHLDSICEFFLNNLDNSLFDEILEVCYSKRQTLDSILKLCIFLDAFKENLSKELFVRTFMESQNIKTDYKAQAMEAANAIRKTYADYCGEVAESLKFNDFESLLDKGKTWLSKEKLSDYKRDKFSKVPFNNEEFLHLKESICNAFIQEESQYLESLYKIFHCFLEAKESYYKRNNCLSFNAVASKVYMLLHNDLISKDFLYFRLDSTLSHILIDEFQDTSILQYEILKPLIDEIKSGIGQKNFLRSFFYVGDVKQSIYRFRGGNPKLFEIAAKDMHKHNLDSNYRSARNIVEFVNHTFKDCIPNFIPQIPKSSTQGFVCVKECEGESLYQEIVESLKVLKAKGAQDEDITILCFNNDTIVELAQFLQKEHFKVVIEASAKLINHNEVRAIINLLQFIHTQNPLFRDSFLMLLGIEVCAKECAKLEDFLQTIQAKQILKQSPAHCILRIMESYCIASLSAKKFLESTLQYTNLEELLSEIKNLALDIVSSDFYGIKLMTIHKSKGLEFENVFVVDKTSRENTQNNAVFFDFQEDDVAIKRIFKNSNKLRQSLDNVYNNALLKEEALKMQDLKNQLYVAFTRAKTTMYIFKLTQKSAFEILNLNATTWGDCAIPFAKNIMTDKKADFCKILEHKYSLENLGRQREIYTQEQDEKEVLEADLGVRYSLQSTYYGIALHFAMEQKLKQQINDSILLEILHNKFGFYLELRSLEKILHRANLLLKNENFIEIVAKGKVKCEIPFLSNGKQKRLDLLILGKNEAWIVDYKSGAPRDSHAVQVREYVECVSEILHKKTHGYILYNSEQEGKLVEIT